MALPVVEVSHLASSTSFYAAVLQSLGLRFLDSTPDRSSVTFGINGSSMLQIRLMSSPRSSYLLLGAPTPSAVADFRAAALRANPASSPDRNANSSTRAVVNDLDGNTIEVIFGDGDLDGGSYEYSRSTIIVNKTTRILQWNYKSASGSGYNHSSSSNANYAGPGSNYASSNYNLGSTQRTTVQRGVSYEARSYAPAPSEAPASTFSQESKTSTLLNATTMVGTLLGVAAGAALTYKMVTNKDKDQAPNQDTRPSAPKRKHS
ncbi:hypothetical protein ESCO_002571 [Escovopsis weberi]|uniref:VOC domain-containing protein n=1 Tax=Escovopsis weberi TaxID=150374 RepID=A0A0M9VT16_ESCWE|nr:hypothetical protein ESCO_002571 [Escovopsis weberi]